MDLSFGVIISDTIFFTVGKKLRIIRNLNEDLEKIMKTDLLYFSFWLY